MTDFLCYVTRFIWDTTHFIWDTTHFIWDTTNSLCDMTHTCDFRACVRRAESCSSASSFSAESSDLSASLCHVTNMNGSCQVEIRNMNESCHEGNESCRMCKNKVPPPFLRKSPTCLPHCVTSQTGMSHVAQGLSHVTCGMSHGIKGMHHATHGMSHVTYEINKAPPHFLRKPAILLVCLTVCVCVCVRACLCV